MKISILILTLVFCISVSTAQNYKILKGKLLFPEITGDSINGFQSSYFNYNTLDTDTILFLINCIDTNVKVTNGCKVPSYWSNLPWIYIGEIAAKCIEKTINPHFSFDRIVKNGEHNALDIDDMRNIKRLYLLWWKTNKNYYKQALRKRREINSPLDGTVYSWEFCPDVKEFIYDTPE